VLSDPQHRPHVITFTSSSTAKNFVALLHGRDARAYTSWVEHIQFASIGPVTSSTLREVGLRADIEAKVYTIPGLIKAITAARRRR
jgi:uroporphyrinogen III methyltransferase/synthase